MRKLIAAMKVSVDEKMEGTDGYADWVTGWSEDYGLTKRIDACLLGGRMYPGYESYWTAIQHAPGSPLPMTDKLALPAELAWAEFARHTPHYVLSSTLDTVNWSNARILRHIEEVMTMKAQAGKDIYLMGGQQLTTSLINAGMVDELHLIVYPLIAGPGKPLFSGTEQRRAMMLRDVQQLDEGRVRMSYAIE